MNFVRSGFKKADSKCFGKTTELSDTVIIRVIIGTMESMQWGRWDGMGSNKHVDFGEDKINCLILSIDTRLNDEYVCGDKWGTGKRFKSTNGNFKWRV